MHKKTFSLHGFLGVKRMKNFITLEIGESDCGEITTVKSFKNCYCSILYNTEADMTSCVAIFGLV